MAEGAETRPDDIDPAAEITGDAVPGASHDMLPVAMVTLDVAGQIRERSPADRAIFGTLQSRLAERFVAPETGRAMLARAVSDSSAEGAAWLATESGPQEFHISLWRQRGGDKIRLIGAFAQAAPASGGSEDWPVNPALARLSQDLRSPLAAAMGFAEMIRSEGRGKGNGTAAAAGHAGSIVAAAWRLAAIVDDLETALRGGPDQPGPRNSEVDLARLVRRVARLADPGARAGRIAIAVDGLNDAGLSVLGDEGMLWSVVDTLTQNALRYAEADSTVRLAIEADEGGACLSVADSGPGLGPADLAAALRDQRPGRGLGLCRHLARLNGADLEVESAPGQGVTARLCFPASRVLDLG